MRSFLVLCILSLVFSTNGFAQFGGQRGKGGTINRVATVDMRALMNESREAQSLQEQLANSDRKGQEKIRKSIVDFEAKGKEYEQKAPTLNEQALIQMETELAEMRNKIINEQVAHQEFMSRQELSMQQAFLDRVRYEIRAIAEELKLQMVFTEGDIGCMFAIDDLDITDVLLQRLNDDFVSATTKA